MPFPDASFDAVINVESSHCYPSMGRFLSEVHRVLRPRGSLLFADLRTSDVWTFSIDSSKRAISSYSAKTTSRRTS
jgi:ubiquinone/menaquinone biosynthesis C-methylase UbiE